MDIRCLFRMMRALLMPIHTNPAARPSAHRAAAEQQETRRQGLGFCSSNSRGCHAHSTEPWSHACSWTLGPTSRTEGRLLWGGIAVGGLWRQHRCRRLPHICDELVQGGRGVPAQLDVACQHVACEVSMQAHPRQHRTSVWFTMCQGRKERRYPLAAYIPC